LVFAQQQVKLVAYALAGDAAQHGQGGVNQLSGARLNGKVQAMLKACCPQDAGRVVYKAEAVQHPNKPFLQVVLPAIEIQDTPGGGQWAEAYCQRVDREI